MFAKRLLTKLVLQIRTKRVLNVLTLQRLRNVAPGGSICFASAHGRSYFRGFVVPDCHHRWQRVRIRCRLSNGNLGIVKRPLASKRISHLPIRGSQQGDRRTRSYHLATCSFGIDKGASKKWADTEKLKRAQMRLFAIEA